MIRARHEGRPHTCVHCGEPVVRLQADGSDAVSRWVHTPSRLHCVDRLTGQQVASVAEVAFGLLPAGSPGVAVLRSWGRR